MRTASFKGVHTRDRRPELPAAAALCVSVTVIQSVTVDANVNWS
jgi:hypothetical protein